MKAVLQLRWIVICVEDTQRTLGRMFQMLSLNDALCVSVRACSALIIVIFTTCSRQAQILVAQILHTLGESRRLDRAIQLLERIQKRLHEMGVDLSLLLFVHCCCFREHDERNE